jgi:hypothetical protein
MMTDTDEILRGIAERVWEADGEVRAGRRHDGAITEGWAKEAFVDDLSRLIRDHTPVGEMVEKLKRRTAMLERVLEHEGPALGDGLFPDIKRELEGEE